MQTNTHRMRAAQASYDNLSEDDVYPMSAVELFLESTSGSNWLRTQANTLVSGEDSDFVTQSQFREHISEHLSGLEWDEDQNSAHVDLIIAAYNGTSGIRNMVMSLTGDDGLEGLAEELLISSGAVELHLTLAANSEDSH